MGDIRNDDIQSMTKDAALKELDTLEKMMEQNEYSIDSKKRELKKIKQNEIVRRYILIDQMIKSLEEDGEKTKQRIALINQKLCNHNIVYLIRLDKKSLLYRPKFKCLNCGLVLHELLDHQVCINESYTTETEFSYLGDKNEYKELSIMYKDAVSEGELNQEIIKQLDKELRKKYKRKTNSLKL